MLALSSGRGVSLTNPSPVEPTANEPFLASVSRLNLYRRCPRAYARKYLLNEPEDLPEAWLKLGQLGKAFHVYAAARESGVAPPRPDIPAEFHKQWANLVAIYESQHWPDDDLVGVEEPLYIMWPDGAQFVKFRGVIDRLEIHHDRARIIDRKTGWRVASADEMRDDLQLSAYALLVADHYPQVNVFEVEQVQYRYQGRSRTAAITREELATFRMALMAEVGRMMRDTEFLPSPTCVLCPPTVHINALQPFRNVEVEFASAVPAVHMEEPTNVQEAQKVAEATQLALALSNVGKDVLRRWTESHGPVMLGAGAWGHWARERMECTDVAAVFQWVVGHGLDPRKFLKVDGTAIRNLVADNPELSKYFVTEVESAFAWRTDGDKAIAKTEAMAEKLMLPFRELIVVEGGKI